MRILGEAILGRPRDIRIPTWRRPVRNRRRHPETFVRDVHIFLIGIGIILLAQAV
jgi:hypothetical protein